MPTSTRRKTPERSPLDVSLFPGLPAQLPAWERDLLLAALLRLLSATPASPQETPHAPSP